MIIGIDPGIKGAIAWVLSDGSLDSVLDMPLTERAGKTVINFPALAEMIRTAPADLIALEEVLSMPGEGHVGAKTTGYGGGVLEGIALGLGIPYRIFHPSNWKRYAGVTSNKNFCRARAMKLWPGSADQFRLVKHDGRADAALLAQWVWSMNRADVASDFG